MTVLDVQLAAYNEWRRRKARAWDQDAAVRFLQFLRDEVGIPEDELIDVAAGAMMLLEN